MSWFVVAPVNSGWLPASCKRTGRDPGWSARREKEGRGGREKSGTRVSIIVIPVRYMCVCVCVAVRARIVDTRTLCGHVCGVCLRGWPHVSKTFRKPFQVQVGNPFSDVGAEGDGDGDGGCGMERDIGEGDGDIGCGTRRRERERDETMCMHMEGRK